MILCSVAYPFTLWAIGRTPFLRDMADGSLQTKDGKPVGSLLIAQPFSDGKYFQPRPSNPSYNAAASGASNWGASNPQLRNRVARQLGPMVRYGQDAEKHGKKPGELVAEDIEAWFQKDHFSNKPGIVAMWAAAHPGFAESWVKDADTALKPQWPKDDKDRDPGQSFLLQLGEDFASLHKELVAGLKDADKCSVADLAADLFAHYSRLYPGQWLAVEDYETKDKEKRKKLSSVTASTDIQAIFFDMWRQDHPNVSLEDVPADMVMQSGSGLDPHITLKNARYQLKYRVADAWVKETGRSQEEVLRKIDELLQQKTFRPLGGLAGEPLVNVLEVNLALEAQFKK